MPLYILAACTIECAGCFGLPVRGGMSDGQFAHRHGAFHDDTRDKFGRDDSGCLVDQILYGQCVCQCPIGFGDGQDIEDFLFQGLP